MAAGPFTVLDVALEKFGEEVFNLDSDAFQVVLTTQAQALAAAFTGASGQALYSDLTAEVEGAGYEAGGEPLTGASWSRAGAVVTFAAASTTWEALTATMKYAVVVRSDGGSPPALADILGFADLEQADPAGRTSAGGDFIINWTGGLFTITRVDP